MVTKFLEYDKDKGEIRDSSSFKSYNCGDEVDMQILCDDMNRWIFEIDSDKKVLNSKIDVVRDILG